MTPDEIVRALRNCGGGPEGIKIVCSAADLIESMQSQLDELRNDYDIADAANTALHGALEYYRRRERAAVEDIHTVYSDGLCEVCGRRDTCLMTLDRGEDGTVCHGIGFEWRGPREDGKGEAE